MGTDWVNHFSSNPFCYMRTWQSFINRQHWSTLIENQNSFVNNAVAVLSWLILAELFRKLILMTTLINWFADFNCNGSVTFTLGIMDDLWTQGFGLARSPFYQWNRYETKTEKSGGKSVRHVWKSMWNKGAKNKPIRRADRFLSDLLLSETQTFIFRWIV